MAARRDLSGSVGVIGRRQVVRNNAVHRDGREGGHVAARRDLCDQVEAQVVGSYGQVRRGIESGNRQLCVQSAMRVSSAVRYLFIDAGFVG